MSVFFICVIVLLMFYALLVFAVRSDTGHQGEKPTWPEALMFPLVIVIVAFRSVFPKKGAPK